MDTSNWALLYKNQNGRPYEFYEIRHLGKVIWLSSGKVKTLGKEEKIEFINIDKAKVYFQEMLKIQTDNGFVITRSGAWDPTRFDFRQLIEEIYTGASKAFSQMRNAHLNEKINAFGLQTDDYGMIIVPVGNSEEAYRKKCNVTMDTAEDFFWNSSEWSYGDGNEFLDIAYRLILTQHRENIPSGITIEQFIPGFFEACVSALQKLDKEGFFGTSAERENVIVLVHNGEGPYNLDAVRRLNTPSMYRRFLTWYKTWN